jgi:hypothetical protein
LAVLCGDRAELFVLNETRNPAGHDAFLGTDFSMGTDLIVARGTRGLRRLRHFFLKQQPRMEPAGILLGHDGVKRRR